MKYLAVVVFALGCGKSDKAASGGGSSTGQTPASGSWTVGGIEVPESAIPKKLGVPTALPKKIGDELLTGELADMAMVVPEKVNVQYVTGDYPDEDIVRGYQVMIYADPTADLEKSWGPATNGCWTAADKKLEVCVKHNDGQQHWYVTTMSTAPAAARPAPPIPPEPAGTYDDYPVGVGPCAVAGIKEISEIAGVQMQYLDNQPDDRACHLLPATTKAASRTSGQVTTSEALKQVPDILIARDKADRVSWTDNLIEGLGDKAAWDFKSVIVQVKGHAYRISVTDANKSLPFLRDRALKIAHKVAARAAALPAE